MQIAVTHTIKSVLPKLDGFTSKQAPFAIAKALTRTAMKAKDNANKSTMQYFDNPVQFTKRAFRFKGARKAELSALVYAGQLQARYLRIQIAGGGRRQKGFEKKFLQSVVDTQKLPPGSQLVPTKHASVNSSGNVSLATIKKIQAGMNGSKRGGFFIGQPRNSNKPAGIYRRSRHQLFPYFIAKESPRRYRKQFPLEDVVAKTVKRHFGAELERAFREALRTAR